MRKSYTDTDVYTATQKRLEYIFDEFDSVCVAFSGGKDSGVLLNLAYDYAKRCNKLSKLSMYHLDYEAQYQMTTDYVERTFLEKYDEVKKYWLCLPISAQCSVSMRQDHWIPWDPSEKNIWVRKMPDNPYVINQDNIPFEFQKGTWDYDLQDNFGRWLARINGKVAMLVGIRSDESLSRQSAITSRKKVNQYKGLHWATKDEKEPNLIFCYPIYDWQTRDIWIANGKFNWDYNDLYTLYYQAGMKIDQMRVASPFNDCAANSLKYYKAIEPNTWGKLVSRVNGVSFAGIYGGTTAMGWRSITLPEGHTWKSYLYFLLSTLPDKVRNNYIEKFNTSIKFWREKGGVLNDETISELDGQIDFKIGKETNYNTAKKPVRFTEYPDDLDVTDFKSVPSYKRMCVCILKNDHACKYMGFAPTKKDYEKRKKMMRKYKNIVNGKI